MVALQGEMDLYAAQIGRKGLRDVVLAHPGEVVIDLRPLTSLDSSGLSVLIALDQDVRGSWSSHPVRARYFREPRD